MSMFDSIARFGAAMARARRNRQTAHMMRSLPVDIQKDVGWPAPAEAAEVSALRSIMVSGGR